MCAVRPTRLQPGWRGAEILSMPGASILVVEDDPAIHMSLCSTLRTLGFTPFHAETASDATSVLERESIEAITLDVTLPDASGTKKSGLGFLEHLRTIHGHADTPVLIFTGTFLSEDDEKFAKKHGAEVHYKPMAYYELVAHLNRLLGRP